MNIQFLEKYKDMVKYKLFCKTWISFQQKMITLNYLYIITEKKI